MSEDNLWFWCPAECQAVVVRGGIAFDPDTNEVFPDLSVEFMSNSDSWFQYKRDPRATYKIVECGCCDHFHEPWFTGDCREDSHRFKSREDFAQREGVPIESVKEIFFDYEADEYYDPDADEN
jgi:hypothetical protein